MSQYLFSFLTGLLGIWDQCCHDNLEISPQLLRKTPNIMCCTVTCFISIATYLWAGLQCSLTQSGEDMEAEGHHTHSLAPSSSLSSFLTLAA